MSDKPQLPADPRFKGATPEKLVRALRKRKPGKEKTSTESKGSKRNA